MTKTVLINVLEQRGFSRPDADAFVSGLTAEMVKAAECETLSAIVGLHGGVIATGLVVSGLLATLMIFLVRPPIDDITTTGIQTKFTEFSEGVATQIANAEVDTHARFDQIEAHLDREETCIGAIEGRLATIETQLNGIDARFDGLNNKIDELRDTVSALERARKASPLTPVRNLDKAPRSHFSAALTVLRSFRARVSRPATIRPRGVQIARSRRGLH